MNACELTLSITALANTIANQLDDEQIGLLGAVLTQLGDTLATISARRALCDHDAGPAESSGKV